MRILITGGTGFIGSRLALMAAGRGDEVHVLGMTNTPPETRNAEQLRAAGVGVTLASLDAIDTIRPLLEGCDVVHHLAAAQHESNVPDEHYRHVNVRCTERLLDACVAAKVGRFVYGSTMGVYGRQPGTLDEASPLKPDSIYGITKVEAENAVLARRAALPVAIARIAEAYGPGDYRLLKLFRAIAKRRFFIIGDGQNRHPLIYIDDLLAGLDTVATHPAAPGEIVILAGEHQPTTLDMAQTVADVLGQPAPSLRAPMLPFLGLAVAMERTLRPLGISPPLHRRRLDFFRRSLTLSHAKAKRLLGFDPRTPFREGAEATARWYREIGEL